MNETTKTDAAAIAGSNMLTAAFPVEDGNKLIGDFMGKNFQDPLNYMYDKDWNQLMEVIERIHLKREVKEVSIHPGRTRIWLQQSFIQSPCRPENNSITECWIACILFIKWYHCQKVVS